MHVSPTRDDTPLSRPRPRVPGAAGAAWLAALTLVCLSAAPAAEPVPTAPAVTSTAADKPAATDPEKTAGGSVFDMGTVTVTANGAPTETTAGTSVTTEDIMDANAHTLRDAVQMVPGVTVSNNGARAEGTVFVRGFDLRQVPVFLDGVPVYVPYDGYGDMNRFTLFDATQVTVEKSTTSVLYGPNTMGGAINLVTRRPTEKIEGSLGGGIELNHDADFTTDYEYFNVGTNQGKWYYQASGSYADRESFDIPDDFVAAPAEAGHSRENSDSVDWRVLQRIGFTPNSTDEYSLTYSTQRAEKGVPPYAGDAAGVVPRYWRWNKWDRDSIYLHTRTALNDDITWKNRLFYDIYDNSVDAYDDATYTTQTRRSSFHSNYDDYSYGGNTELDYELTDTTTLRGVAYLKDDIHREHNHKEPIRHFMDRTLSLALEGVQEICQDWELTVGGRYDRRETLEAENYNSTTRDVFDFPMETADSWNGQVSLAYHLDKLNTVHATYSHTSRLPTIKDRYSYRLGTAIPNPGLKAEFADNYEIGYRGQPTKNVEVETALFYTDVTDTILSVTVSPTLTQMQNVGKSRVMGWEAGTKVDVTRWLEVGSTYTLLDRENLDDDAIKMPDTPEHRLCGYLAWHPIEKLEIRPSATYETSRFSTTNGLRSTGSFALFDLMARYEFLPGATLQTGVQNLTDELYEYTEGYPEPGRVYYARLEYAF